MPSGIRSWRALLAVIVVLCASGCAAVRSYDAELHRTLDSVGSGNVDSAIELLDADNSDKTSLLYQLELGMLQRLGGRYEESQRAWLAASAGMDASRAAGAFDFARLGGAAASYVISDKMRSYQAHDY